MAVNFTLLPFFFMVLFIVTAAPMNDYFTAKVTKYPIARPTCNGQSDTVDSLQGTHYTVTNDNIPKESKQPFLEVRNATYHGYGPREEAKAMCSVRTQEVNATANATITRRLHGVVTSRELHSSIQRLEVIIFGQMQQLWQSLDALRAQLTKGERVTYPDRRTVVFRYQPNAG